MLRRLTFCVLSLLALFLFYLPLLEGALLLLLTATPAIGRVLNTSSGGIASGSVYLDALILSAVLFFGAAIIGLVVVLTVPRVLNRFIKPDKVYRMYGIHDRIHRAITRMTSAKFYTHLFGDSSYIVNYLRWLGYDLSEVEQTGSNFGTEVGHETPYLSVIGTGTMVADGLSIMNADFSPSTFRVSRVSIGPNNFVGNHIAYPVGGRTGANCLLATKVMIPLDGKVREGVGLLGSPSFEIPRSVERDGQFDSLATGPALQSRLTQKNRYNLWTMAMFLLSRWLHVFVITAVGLAAFDYYRGFAELEMAAFFALSILITPVYFVLVERGLKAFRRLKPRYCSIYDPYFWRHERLWKVPGESYLSVFDGTPFKNVIWRGLGVQIGRRVFDDGCYLTERTLVAIGDDCVLNAGSKVQCHSQEDGVFKSDRTSLGAGCTLGVGAMVHYGVTMADGSELAADSFLMKGEEVPSHTRWGEIRRGRGDMSSISPSDPVTTAVADRDFWRGVLLQCGFTAIPRWSRDPAPGVAEKRAPVPTDLTISLRRLADELAVPLSSVLLAAHAKVLAALSGEHDVTTGYIASVGGSPLPCPLTTESGSWRSLVQDAWRAESRLWPHKDFPVSDLGRELGRTEPSFETVFDPAGEAGRGARGGNRAAGQHRT